MKSPKRIRRSAAPTPGRSKAKTPGHGRRNRPLTRPKKVYTAHLAQAKAIQSFIANPPAGFKSLKGKDIYEWLVHELKKAEDRGASRIEREYARSPVFRSSSSATNSRGDTYSTCSHQPPCCYPHIVGPSGLW